MRDLGRFLVDCLGSGREGRYAEWRVGGVRLDCVFYGVDRQETHTNAYTRVFMCSQHMMMMVVMVVMMLLCTVGL